MSYHILISGPENVPSTSRPLDKSLLIIGSDPECDIVLSGPGVAGKHVRFLLRGLHAHLEVCEGAVVERLGREVRQLRPGDCCRVDYLPFKVGPYTLQADRKRWADVYEEQSGSYEEEDSEP